MSSGRTERDGYEGSSLRSAGAFLILIALFESVVALLSRAGTFLPLMEWTASVTGYLANVTGVAATVSRWEVFLGDQTLAINAECVGVYLIGAYLALVLASPAPPLLKLRGSILGVLAIVVANFARLLITVHLSDKFPVVFPFVHDYLAQVGMIAVVLGVWALWIGEVRKRAT